jgi:hypothetical protein
MSGLVILGIGFIAAVLIKRASKQRTERERQGVLEDSNESDSNESDYISDNEGLSTKEPARPRTYKNCSHFPQHVVDRSSYPYNMYYPDKCPKCTVSSHFPLFLFYLVLPYVEDFDDLSRK